MDLKKDQKSLKERLNTLDLFIRYIDITKIKLQQQLSRIQAQLNQLEVLENANFNDIIKQFKTNTWQLKKTKLEVQKPKVLYILVDGLIDDHYHRYLYQKMEEDLAKADRQQIAVITFGYNVNRLAARLELKVVKHYDYQIYQDIISFQELVANLCEITIKNHQADVIRLIICQQDYEHKNFVNMQLFPFIPTANRPHQGLISKATSDYLHFIQNFPYQKANYYANVQEFILRTHKLITKEQIGQLNLKEAIARIKIKIQQLDDKLNELNDEQQQVHIMLNRVRQEKATAANLILYAAFKTHRQGGNDSDIIRKKTEDEWFLPSPNQGGLF